MKIFLRLCATIVAMFLALPTPAALAVQDAVVSEQPVWDEPRVMDGRIYAIDSHGNDVIVGGTFTSIRNAPGTSPLQNQRFLFKFNVVTGDIDPAFDPVLNGEVEGLAISADGSSVFVGGDFTSVNGVTRNRLVKLSTADGSIDPTFNASVNGRIKDLALSGDRVIIGGQFGNINGTIRERLGAVNPITGAVLSNFNVQVLTSRDQFGPYVQELDVSSNGQWLLIGGNFQTVGGLNREQIALINLTGNASVANWSTDGFRNDCASVYNDTWIRGLDISPDNSYFVVNTTGAHRGSSLLCDTATRWEMPPAATGDGQLPTWTLHTGGDTHWAVEITESAVYVGGHQRWENNPFPSPGGDNDGPGSVSRPGIAALDPVSGVPLSWNPGRDRGRGVEAMHATDDYLFVGSDTVMFDGQVRQRLAVLPVAGGSPNPAPELIDLPVNLYFSTGGAVLSRAWFDGVEFGASEIVSGPGVDGEDWSGVRDAFVQNDELHYFGPSNAFFSRPFDGVDLGTPVNLSTSVGYVDTNANLTPYDQPFGVDLTQDADYARGRIFYTKSNDNRLWWRWYSLESGIIGGLEYVASNADWSGATALMVAGDFIYASWVDGNLYRMHIQGNVADFAGRVVVDNGASGILWSAVSLLFAAPADGTAPPIDPPPPLVCEEPTPWRAAYFANRTLTGPPLTERCEAAVNYNWGNGSPPGSGVGPDNFSVRWVRSIDLASAAVLSVTTTSDDGVRIYVDGARIIDQWRDQGATTFTGESGTLEPGEHEIVVEKYDRSGSAVISVNWVEMAPPPPPDTVAPDASVNTPSNGAVITESAVAVTGVATDDRDVAQVRVGVRDVGAGLWLQADGVTWGTAIAWMPAALDAPGTTSTGWALNVTLADGSYAISATAVDGAENQDATPAWSPFLVDTNPVPSDSAPPDAQVTDPVANATLNNWSVSISGLATDNVGVTAVQVAIRDTTARLWLQSDGVTWASSFSSSTAMVAAAGATSTGWSFNRVLPDGNYAIDVRAADAAGNLDPTPPWVRFSVSTAAPDTAPANANVESPVPFSVVGSPLLAEGTASDDTGVTQVRVAVRDVAANLWLQSDGVTWATSYAAFQAVLAFPGATATDWTFQVALAPGSYALEVKARDAAGNIDPTPPWVRFTVVDP